MLGKPRTKPPNPRRSPLGPRHHRRSLLRSLLRRHGRNHLLLLHGAGLLLCRGRLRLATGPLGQHGARHLVAPRDRAHAQADGTGRGRSPHGRAERAARACRAGRALHRHHRVLGCRGRAPGERASDAGLDADHALLRAPAQVQLPHQLLAAERVASLLARAVARVEQPHGAGGDDGVGRRRERRIDPDGDHDGVRHRVERDRGVRLRVHVEHHDLAAVGAVAVPILKVGLARIERGLEDGVDGLGHDVGGRDGAGPAHGRVDPRRVRGVGGPEERHDGRELVSLLRVGSQALVHILPYRNHLHGRGLDVRLELVEGGSGRYDSLATVPVCGPECATIGLGGDRVSLVGDIEGYRRCKGCEADKQEGEGGKELHTGSSSGVVGMQVLKGIYLACQS
ncbi:hypothetical protein DFH27DRAFT_271243 [Peziza echinospora]|nr:hypothetical protein DFH27DRAFT_271243 [Peziza echinospora]